MTNLAKAVLVFVVVLAQSCDQDCLEVRQVLDSYFPRDGQLFPYPIDKVYIDVGAHIDALFTKWKLDEEPNSVVIALEPLEDSHEKLSLVHDRVIALNMAVSSKDGYATFHRTEFSQCSSLLNIPSPSGTVEGWYDGCANVQSSFRVPTVRLDSIISRLRGTKVYFIKSDTQGHELEVVKSAGDYLWDIDKVMLEVLVTNALYEGSASVTEVVDYMHSYGFRHVATLPQSQKKEANLLFDRTTRQPLPIEVSQMSLSQWYTRDDLLRLEQLEQERPTSSEHLHRMWASIKSYKDHVQYSLFYICIVGSFVDPALRQKTFELIQDLYKISGTHQWNLRFMFVDRKLQAHAQFSQFVNTNYEDTLVHFLMLDAPVNQLSSSEKFRVSEEHTNEEAIDLCFGSMLRSRFTNEGLFFSGEAFTTFGRDRLPINKVPEMYRMHEFLQPVW